MIASTLGIPAAAAAAVAAEYPLRGYSSPSVALGTVGTEPEVQYLFTLHGTPYPGTLTASQQRLAQTMQRYWTGFAATGVPISERPRFTPASTQTVTLSAQGAVITTDNGTEHHCDFWAATG